jgi:ribosome-associated toxin RatA of RatAB toxin-antitoxin module
MISGEQTTEIAASREAVFAIVSDLERYPEWQEFLERVVVRERDAAGRAVLVEAEADAGVKTLRLELRCTREPPQRMAWRSEGGDLKELAGAFELADAGPGRTRAAFRLDVDPGRRYGLLLRGPVADRLRDSVLSGMLDGLRRRAEAGKA